MIQIELKIYRHACPYITTNDMFKSNTVVSFVHAIE
jgi:hypothetical protein